MPKKSDTDISQQLSELIQVLKEREDSTQTLIKRVDKVFSLFEEASKHVGEVQSAEMRINTLSTKLEALLEQNKVIAQGLVLLEKYVRGKTRLEPNVPGQKQDFASH